MSKIELLKDIDNAIENFVHLNSERELLRRILCHAIAAYEENEKLKESNTKLSFENVRLSVYEKFYEDHIQKKSSRVLREVPKGWGIDLNYSEEE